MTCVALCRQPNFQLPLSTIYPPENGLDESCYIAQLKYFFSEYKYKILKSGHKKLSHFYNAIDIGIFFSLGNFEDAKKYRDKFRPQMSAVYNPNRLVENPIPSLDCNHADENLPNIETNGRENSPEQLAPLIDANDVHAHNQVTEVAEDSIDERTENNVNSSNRVLNEENLANFEACHEDNENSSEQHEPDIVTNDSHVHNQAPLAEDLMDTSIEKRMNTSIESLYKQPQSHNVANDESNGFHRNRENVPEQMTSAIRENESYLQNDSVKYSMDEEMEMEDELNDLSQTNDISGSQSQLAVGDMHSESGAIDQNDDVKNAFIVQVSHDDAVAINDLFSALSSRSGDGDDCDDGLAVDSFVPPSLTNIELATNETAIINAKGQIEITKKIDKDLTCMYIYGERPVPLAPFYNVKIGDSVSNNIPYKENVSAVFFFLLQIAHFTFFFKRDKRTEHIWCELMVFSKKSNLVPS